MRHTLTTLVITCAILLLSACKNAVVYGVDQKQALEITTSLRQNGLHATARPDGTNTWRIELPNEESHRAAELIVDQHLLRTNVEAPPPIRSNFDPSAALRAHEEERAQRITQGLKLITDVREAHVSVSLCEPSTRAPDRCQTPNRVSAILVMNPFSEPPDHHDLQSWLAASLPGTSVENVEILITYAQSVSAAHPKEDASNHVNHLPETLRLWLAPAAIIGLLLLLAGRWLRRTRKPIAHHDLLATRTTQSGGQLATHEHNA